MAGAEPDALLLCRLYHKLRIPSRPCGNTVFGEAHNNHAVLTDVEAGRLIHGGKAPLAGSEKIGKAVGISALGNLDRKSVGEGKSVN